MSAIQMIINNMKSLSEVERSQVFAAFDSVGPIAPVSPVEAKKPRSNAGMPTCHGDFTKKILSEQKEAVAAFKAANPEMKGSHLTFVSNYKKEQPEEFEAFKAQWNLDHPAVVPPPPAEDAKPKKVISEEQKAKMKAGREAAAAAKKANKDAVIVLPEPVAVPAPEPEPVAVAAPAPEAKKRGPKKLTDMTPEELAIHEARKAERKAKKESGSGTTSPARSVSPKEKAE
jgi:hypothetical protein